MTGLEVLLAVAGFTVTVLVVAAMVLITPRAQVEVGDRSTDSQGRELSRADVTRGSDAPVGSARTSGRAAERPT